MNDRGGGVADVALPRFELAVDHPRRDGNAYHAAKRAIDITVASLALLALSPLLLLVALAIKLNSRGPVIFAQQRLRGRRIRQGGAWVWVVEPFILYKFRTMIVDADPSPHREYMAAYLAGDEERLSALRPGRKAGESYRPAHDPRVTQMGSLLRKLSVDELPQLWNVLKGEMSLVGPRPPLPYEVEMYDDEHLRRLAGRPGITGWAQVKGRTGIGFQDVVRLDLDYIARRSAWLDLWILLITIPIVLSTKGAD